MSKKSRNKKAIASHANTNLPVNDSKPFVLKMFNRPMFNLILIVVLGIIIYSNTLNSPFIWDDDKLILNNAAIRNLSNFTDFSGTRYLTYLSFALNYRLNGYDVTGYHVFNIAVHIINAILVYFLIIMVFKTPVFKEKRISELSSVLALFSGLLFVSHPVHTMAVTNINQRSVPLATLFFLLAIIAFIKAKLSSGDFFSKKHLPFYVLSVVSAVFAMKCKEISFTLPIVIFIFDRYFFGKEQSFKKSLVYLIPVLLTLLIIPLSKPQADVFNQADQSLFRIEGETALSVVDAKLSNIPRKDYMLTGLRAVLTYMRLFFVPANLNLAYDYPIYRSFLDPNVFLSFFVLLIILTSAVYLFMKAGETNRERNLLISFGIIWFFINLLLESFVVVLNYVIFEYRLYLPSVGIMLVLTSVTGHVIGRTSKALRYLSISVFVVVIAIFSAATYMRNSVYKNAITVWEDVVGKSPALKTAHNNLGVAYEKQGLFSEAMEKYKVALKLNPNYAEAHYNLGNVSVKQGDLSKAIEQYKEALKLSPDYAEVRYNLGNAYAKTGRLDEAVEEYKNALKLNPDIVMAHNNLGNIYAMQGRLGEAVEEYKMALRLNPDYEIVHANLGNIYIQEGRLNEAIAEYKAAIKITPDNATTRYNLGAAYLKTGMTDEARKEFEAVLTITPDDNEARKALLLIQKARGQQ